MNTLSFWKYGAGDPFKEFLIDLYPYESVNRIFSVYPETTYYYIGKGAEPEIGDFVYFEKDKDSLFIGDSKYYAINSTTWIQVELGLVIDKGAILEDIPMIMEVETTDPNTVFRFSRGSEFDIDGVQAAIDWGDGNTTVLTTDNWTSNSIVSHTYEDSGTYQISISGHLYFLDTGSSSFGHDSAKLITKLLQWGDLGSIGINFVGFR